MTLRRRRSNYQQLAEFEQGSMIELKKSGFSFHDIEERLGRNVSTVHNFWQQWSREEKIGKPLSQENYRPTTHREEKPEIWFFQVEALFSITNIKREETKFNYLVVQLDSKFIENIWDITQSDEKNKYSCAISRLLNTFKESEEKCIKKLLTGISLGDMKPSQLL
ncbi:uncharacterized protein TNCV_1072741 [Trichonephila clavipes]|nr:uncharacterized protein TNCV_1072741 [Trichonephila clavipes]